MKRGLIALGLGLTLFRGSVGAADLPDLYINGTPSESVAYVEHGTTYVSLRQAAQALNRKVQVAWENGQAVVRGNAVELSAVPGEYWLKVNGRYLYIADGVRLEEGKTLVPIRVLAEAFGAQVEWNAETESIFVHSTSSPPTAEHSDETVYWLSRIISAESRGESLVGQIAVGNVVLNRVKDPGFPNTVYGVIFDQRWGGQFEPVRNGTIYLEPTQQSIIAAKLCLEGASVAGNSLYFLDPVKAENLWTVHNRPYIMTIGVHDFYG